MPLNTTQKELIVASVEHLFYDMPSEEKAFYAEIDSIRTSLTEKNPSCKNDHLILHDCFYQPTQKFNRLETLNKDPITIHEVRVYIIDIIDDIIVSHAKKNAILLSKLHWDKTEIIQQLKKIQVENQSYLSEKPQTDSDTPPYPIPKMSGQLFDGHLVVDVENNKVNAMLKIHYSETESDEIKIEVSELIEFKGDNIDEEQDAFLTDLAHSSYEKALTTIIEAVLCYLVNNKYITDKDADQDNPYAARLLSYSDYLTLLKRSIISYNDLCQLTSKDVKILENEVARKVLLEKKSSIRRLKCLNEDEIECLNHPEFIELVTKYDIDFYDLLALNHSQKMLVKHYYYQSLLKNKELKIFDLAKLNDNQCNNLHYPAYINLQLVKKAKLIDIIHLPEHVKNIVSHPFYYNLIAKNIIALSLFIKSDKSCLKSLLNTSIMRLMTEGQISVNLALELKPRTITLLTKDPAVCFILKHKLIAPEHIIHLHRDKYLTPEDKHISIKPHEIYHKAIFKRLLEEFFKYAKNLLLFDNDLYYLFSEATQLKEDSLESKEDKTTESILFKVKGLKHRCITNIRARLQDIMQQAIEPLSTTNHTIHDLKKHCLELNINIYSIMENEFSKEIEKLCNTKEYNDIYTMGNVLTLLGKVLHINNENVLIKFFSDRLFALYENLPFHFKTITDNATLIKTELEILCATYFLDANKVSEHVLLTLIRKIKIQLSELLDAKSITHQTFYHDIVTIIKKSEETSSIRPEAVLQAICQRIDKQIKEFQQSNTDITHEKHQKRRKLTSTLFLPIYTMNSSNGVMDFCERIKTIAQFVSARSVSTSSYILRVTP